MLGKPVVFQLIQAGMSVTALVRDVEKAKKTLPAEVNLVEGDLQNTAAIEKSLLRAETIYISLSVDPVSAKGNFQPEREGIQNILAIAKRFPLKRIAYLSSMVQDYSGFDWWVFDLKKRTTEAVKGCGIPYLIFYPSNFMENIPERFIQGNKIMLAEKSTVKNYWIAAADYARQVTRALQTNSGEVNREYIVQGLEGLTLEEASEQFVKYYPKRRIKIAKAPLGLLKLLGLFSNNLSYVAKIVEAIGHYPETFQAETTWQELGKPSITIQDFARQYQ